VDKAAVVAPGLRPVREVIDFETAPLAQTSTPLSVALVIKASSLSLICRSRRVVGLTLLDESALLASQDH
jgi:hypothetical protein